MDEIVARLEALLERFLQPSAMSEEEFEVLPAAWEEEVARLTEAVNAPGRVSDPALRRRLEQVLARMPDVQRRIREARTELTAQMQSVNRNLQALRSAEADTGPNSARMVSRKV